MAFNVSRNEVEELDDFDYITSHSYSVLKPLDFPDCAKLPSIHFLPDFSWPMFALDSN